MPQSRRGRMGMRNQSHRSHTRKSRHQRKKRKTRKNRLKISTPFDIISELRNKQLKKKHLTKMEISTNPFGRTAVKKYGVDPRNLTGKEVSKLATRIFKKRSKRRKQGLNELTKMEQKLVNKERSRFLEAMEDLRPDFWNKKAWADEVIETTDPQTISSVQNTSQSVAPLTLNELSPIKEVIIREMDVKEDEPTLSLANSSMFRRRKTRRNTGKGNKKKKRGKRKKKRTKRKHKRGK